MTERAVSAFHAQATALSDERCRFLSGECARISRQVRFGEPFPCRSRSWWRTFHVDAWIASQSKAVQIAYEYSGTFVRTEPMMADGFAAMGFREEQINGFILAASTL